MSNYGFHCFYLCFGVISKELLPNLISGVFVIYILKKYLTVFPFTFRSLLPCDLTFVQVSR